MVTEKQKANLIPTTKRTARERSELGRKGAIASNKAKKEKRKWKEILSIMLSTPAQDDVKQVLKRYGIENATIEDAILFKGVISQAMKNDKWAIEQMAKITGNYEAEKVEVSGNVTDIADKIKDYARKKSN